MSNSSIPWTSFMRQKELVDQESGVIRVRAWEGLGWYNGSSGFRMVTVEMSVAGRRMPPIYLKPDEADLAADKIVATYFQKLAEFEGPQLFAGSIVAALGDAVEAGKRKARSAMLEALGLET